MGITLLTLLIVAAGIIGYLHFYAQKENDVETDSPLQSYPEPTKPTEPDYIFLFAGNTIDRDGKHFQWNYELNKYEEVSSSFTVSASEPIAVHTTQSDVILTVESQITDAVTTKPVKPKKKRGRKPTKKVKK